MPSELPIFKAPAYTLATDAAGVAALAEEVAAATDAFALDTETTGLDPKTEKIRLLQIDFGDDRPGRVVDLFATGGECLQPLWDALEDDDGQPVVMHNANFDVAMLWTHGCILPPRADSLHDAAGKMPDGWPDGAELQGQTHGLQLRVRRDRGDGRQRHRDEAGGRFRQPGGQREAPARQGAAEGAAVEQLGTPRAIPRTAGVCRCRSIGHHRAAQGAAAGAQEDQARGHRGP